jgi:hypothetical protein
MVPRENQEPNVRYFREGFVRRKRGEGDNNNSVTARRVYKFVIPKPIY